MSPPEPPNLRLSDSDEDCQGCMYFDSDRQVCTLYHDRPVDPAMVCDSYEALEAKPVSLDDDE